MSAPDASVCEHDVAALRALLKANRAANANNGTPNARPSLRRALWSVYGRNVVALFFLKLTWGALTIASAYAFLRGILLYVTAYTRFAKAMMMMPPVVEPEPVQWHATAYAVAMIVASLLATFAVHRLYSDAARLQLRVASALGVLAHERIFVRGDRGAEFAGAAVALIGTDCADVGASVVAVPYALTNVLEVVAICVLAITAIGVSALPAVGVLIIIVMPLLWLSSRAMISANWHTVTSAKRHADASSEFLTAIKLAKYNAWEDYFAARIQRFRVATEEGLVKRSRVRAATYALVFAVPVIIAAIAFPMYDSLNPGMLTATIAFSIISLFNMLRYPLLSSPQVAIDLSGGLVGLRRIEEHLFSVYVDDLQFDVSQPKKRDVLFELKNAAFAYPGMPPGAAVALRRITLRCERGKVLAVVGATGSGKTTLMLAILRRLHLRGGTMTERAGVQRSFAQQDAWLFAGTIRDNILFGSEFDAERYAKVIEACCMETDLQMMDKGDLTVLGERGAGLSGGQKQRVSVARAAYSRAPLVLLDDPLSALDAKVGRVLFEKCIRGFLKDRAVVLVTHALHCAARCDSVVRMRNGVVAAFGAPADVLPHEDDAPIEVPDEDEAPLPTQMQLSKLSAVTSLSARAAVNTATMYTVHDDAKNTWFDSATIDAPSAEDDPDDSDLESAESHDGESKRKSTRGAKAKDGAAAPEQSRAAIAYAVSSPGGWVSGLLFLAFYSVHGVRIAGDFWLSFWSGNALGLSVPVYAGGYAAFAIGFVIGVYLRNVFLGSVTQRKSHALHNAVLDKLTRAPLSFFEQVPFGTTLALLTKHLSVVDRNLPDTLAEALQYSPLAIGSAFVGMAVVPWSFITLILLLPAMGLLMWKYMPAQNIAMGVEVQSRTRVFEVIASHAQGAVTIVAFGAQERVEGVMFRAFNKLLDNAAAHKSIGTRIAVWMDVLVTVLIGAVALLVVHLPLSQTPSRAGLAIANVLQLLVFTQWSVKAVFASRNNVESAGVMAKAIEVIASEAAPPKSPPQLPEPWPERGEIEFDRVAIRYGGPGGRVALRDITLRIKPQEHIGVVGRTGSGKSSLVASLFRIVELFGNGSIKIDGIKTTELPLAYLRSHIAIVPQESVVLADTVRRNLDPVGRFEGDNETLWRALRRVKLAQLVERAPGGLDALIDETGNDDDNNTAQGKVATVRLSAGQRQLLCIARASLMSAKIVTLDEATAAIDRASDEMAQRAMARAFKGRTVFTIAHRLDTVITSDRILVLDGGRVVEFDTPTALLAKRDGMLRMLVDSTGPAVSARLNRMAQDAAREKGVVAGADLDLLRIFHQDDDKKKAEAAEATNKGDKKKKPVARKPAPKDDDDNDDDNDDDDDDDQDSEDSNADE